MAGRVQSRVGGDKYMKRFIPALGVLALVLFLAAIAAAQNTGQIVGEVKDLNGKPYADVTVEIKNPDNWNVFTTKTDKSGRFTQVGVPGGTYVVTLTKAQDQMSYAVKFPVESG